MTVHRASPTAWEVPELSLLRLEVIRATMTAGIADAERLVTRSGRIAWATSERGPHDPRDDHGGAHGLGAVTTVNMHL